MQKLYTLIFLSALISCAPNISQEKKQLKGSDLDGDQILETKESDLIANIPTVLFDIDNLDSDLQNYNIEALQENRDFQNIVKEIGNQKVALNVETSALHFFPVFRFPIKRSYSKEHFDFTISNNQSLNSISNMVLKVSVEGVTGVNDYIYLTEDQLWNKEKIPLNLTNLLPYFSEDTIIKIEVSDFYFERNNKKLNYLNFYSQLRLKNYVFSIVRKDNIQLYLVSKTINILSLLKILRFDVDQNEVGFIKEINKEENHFPLKNYSSMESDDSFWILTNINGQSLFTYPKAGSHVSLVHFTKRDFLDYGLQQEEFVIGFNQVPARKLKLNSIVESIEIKNIIGEVLIPEQDIGKKSISYEYESSRGSCAGRCKSSSSKRYCRVKTFSVKYKRVAVESYLFNDHFDQILSTRFHPSNGNDFTLTLAPESNHSIIVGTKNIDCPNSISTKRENKIFPTLIDGRVTLIKRIKP